MKIEMLNVGWMSAAAKILRQGDERILVNTGLPVCIPARSPTRELSTSGPMPSFTLEQERDVSEQVDVAALTRMGGYGNKTKTAAYRLRVSRDRIDEEAPR
jgi:hypothetical protein